MSSPSNPDRRAAATAAARDAYRARAAEYIDALGSMRVTAAADRALVGEWADAIGGRMLDVGCGPGHWTAWLHERGCDIEGVDPVPEFVEHARVAHAGVPFRVGVAERLSAPDASVAGIVAWYSLIHVPHDEIGGALGEFARVLRAGGGLVLGFCEGPEPAPFDHAVTTAYFWPIDALAARVEAAGFEVTGSHARSYPGAGRHGAIVARRLTNA